MLRYVRASGEDQGKIEEFLSQFVNDYVAARVPRYVVQKTGGLYLALDQEEIVGTAVITFPRRHEAVISGLRIAPPRQGSTVTEEFSGFQLNEAIRLGAHVVRTLVSKDHQPVKALWTDLGFVSRGDWTIGKVTGTVEGAYAPEDAGPAWALDRERLEAFWHAHSNDIWARVDPWSPETLTLEDIFSRFEQGGVAVAPQRAAEAVDSIALYQMKSREVLAVQYLESGGEHLKSLLQFLLLEARAWGIAEVEYGLPAKWAGVLAEALHSSPQDQWLGTILEKRLGDYSEQA